MRGVRIAFKAAGLRIAAVRPLPYSVTYVLGMSRNPCARKHTKHPMSVAGRSAPTVMCASKVANFLQPEEIEAIQ